MFEIETFTAQPDLVEDRIRLDTVSPDGRSATILLTRRLTDRFLPLLINAVEQSARSGLPREIALAMEQQKLRIERHENPVPDVIVAKGSAQWLCRTIHIESRSDHLLWTLTDDGGNTAAMALPGETTRAVLDVFLLMYRQLEWSEQVFPAWMTEADEPAGSPHMLN